MGYMRHHAIIVTSCSPEHLITAYHKAMEIFPWVSPLSDKKVNGYVSFFIPPDGSKEGWKESDEGDRQRKEFIAFLRSMAYEDGSNPIDWCEVQYGDDDGEDRLLPSPKRKGKTMMTNEEPAATRALLDEVERLNKLATKARLKTQHQIDLLTTEVSRLKSLNKAAIDQAARAENEIERLKAEKTALISACARAVDFDSAYDVRNHVRAAIIQAEGMEG